MAPEQQPPRDADEQEFEFMIADRRGKMAGLWAAELMGLIGQAAHDYALRFRRGGKHYGESATAEALEHDLRGKASGHEIREKMGHLLAEARRQLIHEKKKD